MCCICRNLRALLYSCVQWRIPLRRSAAQRPPLLRTFRTPRQGPGDCIASRISAVGRPVTRYTKCLSGTDLWARSRVEPSLDKHTSRLSVNRQHYMLFLRRVTSVNSAALRPGRHGHGMPWLLRLRLLRGVAASRRLEAD